MDTTDTLQMKIDKAREEMSPLSRGAIDAVNWVEIIFSMNTKYNAEQLENLKVETELLLCGLTSTIDFPKELETRMKIPHSEVASLLDQMDKLIFKKMQEKLEEKLNQNNVPSEVSNQTKNQFKSQIPLPPYATSNKQNVVNSKYEEPKSAPVIQREESVLDMTTKPEINSASSHSIETDMYREHGIEIVTPMSTSTPSIIRPEIKKTIQNEISNAQEPAQQTDSNLNNFNQSNIIANKLFNNTTSQKVVTDYSIPKINPQIDPTLKIQGVAPSKPHDPYHEEI